MDPTGDKKEGRRGRGTNSSGEWEQGTQPCNEYGHGWEWTIDGPDPVIDPATKGLAESIACIAKDGHLTDGRVATLNCNGVGVHTCSTDVQWGGGDIKVGKGKKARMVKASTMFEAWGEFIEFTREAASN